MALIATLEFEANGRETVNLFNKDNGSDAIYTYIASGTFGGGTVAVEVSPDSGATWVTNINGGSTLSFADAQSDNLLINSTAAAPVLLGFNLTGATSPDVTIKVYDSK